MEALKDVPAKTEQARVQSHKSMVMFLLQANVPVAREPLVDSAAANAKITSHLGDLFAFPDSLKHKAPTITMVWAF